MDDPVKIKMPASYAGAQAIGFSDTEGYISLINPQNPLPVVIAGGGLAPSPTGSVPAPPALRGETAQSMQSASFEPAPDRPVVLTLSGEWTGSVTIRRSGDGGATFHNLTAGGSSWGVYTANACEPFWQEPVSGAQLALFIQIDSGTLSYEVAQ
ncbi:hypothetical protein [Croceicoccus sp. YJ47]|uniref:hypothetical protein n=1 Tax=Croceicoccus sp. YJ47 TaxID=2798724 RepID=UPI001923CAB5|nr:hypothetical protein [Croceicoccus sp. YJ47]QQN72992.1 hypothetical protein JD971_08770 [Croceicoccus sp. YJ47]